MSSYEREEEKVYKIPLFVMQIRKIR